VLETLRVERTHGQRQVAEGLGPREVQPRRRVVGEYPWKHGVLRQVVERAAGERVEVHQVLEVGYLVPQPLGRDLFVAAERIRGRARVDVGQAHGTLRHERLHKPAAVVARGERQHRVAPVLPEQLDGGSPQQIPAAQDLAERVEWPHAVSQALLQQVQAAAHAGRAVQLRLVDRKVERLVGERQAAGHAAKQVDQRDRKDGDHFLRGGGSRRCRGLAGAGPGGGGQRDRLRACGRACGGLACDRRRFGIVAVACIGHHGGRGGPLELDQGKLSGGAWRRRSQIALRRRQVRVKLVVDCELAAHAQRVLLPVELPMHRCRVKVERAPHGALVGERPRHSLPVPDGCAPVRLERLAVLAERCLAPENTLPVALIRAPHDKVGAVCAGAFVTVLELDAVQEPQPHLVHSRGDPGEVRRPLVVERALHRPNNTVVHHRPRAVLHECQEAIGTFVVQAGVGPQARFRARRVRRLGRRHRHRGRELVTPPANQRLEVWGEALMIVALWSLERPGCH